MHFDANRGDKMQFTYLKTIPSIVRAGRTSKWMPIIDEAIGQIPKDYEAIQLSSEVTGETAEKRRATCATLREICNKNYSNEVWAILRNGNVCLAVVKPTSTRK